MLRILIVVLLATVCAQAHAVKPRDINKLKKEQQATQKAIRETSKKITVNTRETEQQLNRLNTLRSEISAKSSEINAMKAGMDSLDAQITGLTDSIDIYNERLEKMKARYAAALKHLQTSQSSMNALAFIFASESFRQAYQRIRYLNEFAGWRAKKTDELKAATTQLADRRAALAQLHNQRGVALTHLNLAQQQLENKQQETGAIVDKLKKEGTALRAYLKEKEAQARALDRELDKLIAAEQARIEKERKAAERAAKPSGGSGSATASRPSGSSSAAPKPASGATTGNADADRTLSGNFESNKGRLLFPVSGKYTIVRGFGRQKHPELAHVETDNSGIDIEVPAGTSARAIFAGTVSGIFQQPGFNTIVMVRHGSYISIYANLGSIAVKKGDEVKANQPLGVIYSDPDNDNRSVFHFELRNERTKLNPLLWVK